MSDIKISSQPRASLHEEMEPPEKHVALEQTPNHMLHKQLETRHMTMIALGGALGTGLLIGTYEMAIPV